MDLILDINDRLTINKGTISNLLFCENSSHFYETIWKAYDHHKHEDQQPEVPSHNFTQAKEHVNKEQ